MKIYEVKETGLRMRVPGCYECPNRTKTRWGDVCIAIPIKEKGKDTGFYKDIEPWAKDGIGPRLKKVLKSGKDFLIITETEPYYVAAYGVIRLNEKEQGTWSPEDEARYIKSIAKVMGDQWYYKPEGEEDETDF